MQIIYILDCSQPFLVRHGSDMSADEGGDQGSAVASENTSITNRGKITIETTSSIPSNVP